MITTLTLNEPTTLADVENWMRMIRLLNLPDHSPIDISLRSITVTVEEQE